MRLGRKQIFTNEKEITRENLLDVLRKVIPEHNSNSTDMDYLIRYEAGDVTPIREKVYRKDIANFVPDPIANYIVEFKLGFEWGNPITFVQSDDDDVEDNETLTKALSMLNQNYRAQNIKTKQQQMARFLEICGVAYTYVDTNMEWQDGDSFFTVDVIDPRWGFVVRSNAFTDKRVILGVVFHKDDDGEFHYTCFTRTTRFEVEGTIKIEREDMNPLGRIPVIEWIRSYDRQGCFERLIPMIDDVTFTVSSFLDDVQSNTDAIWFGTDIEFEKEIVTLEDGTTKEVSKKPKNGEWALAYSSKDGKAPTLKPLSIDYDYPGILENISSTRNHIWRLAHVPQRNDNSGGSTGVAMDDAAGWTDAEAEACRKQMLSDSSKMEEVAVVLAAVRMSPYINQDNPLMQLRYSDVAPNFKRSKTYDLVSKCNSFATMLSHGFALEDLVANIPLFEDGSQVVARSGEGVRKYQESIWAKSNEADGGEGESPVNADRLQADLSDQIGNSEALRVG